MPQITRARAYANGSVALICWDINGKIPGCLGFDVTRIYPDTGERKQLASWVPFEGQSNPSWQPQTTAVWPIQRLMWRDLTLRQRRDSLTLRDANVTVRYEIRPVGPLAGGENISAGAAGFTGPSVPLQYVGDAVATNDLVVTTNHGDVDCAFTNGILSTQFLVRAFEQDGVKLTPDNLKAAMKDRDGAIRKYLAGDVLPLIRDFIGQAGGGFHQALYELEDEELVELIQGLQNRDDLILSNTSKDDKGVWDVENAPVRQTLGADGVNKTDRMFNNDHIGHNKYSVWSDGNGGKAVLTGSTNWTTTGLCAQSNNALVIRSAELAAQYLSYWENLKTDTAGFTSPATQGAGTANKQGQALRTANASKPDELKLSDGTQVQAWFSPNTRQATKPSGGRAVATPPDLDYIFSRMRKANRLILFAVFLPSQGAHGDITGEAVSLAMKDSSLMVYGCLSDPTAMPNFVAKPRDGDDNRTPEEKQPHTYDTTNVHLVRATALDQSDITGSFEKEVLKSSPGAHAIIHDKIIVVDPLDQDGFVVAGSHNLGVKASYENDENFLVIWNNPTLIRAYAVHVMDLFDHYRFRARQSTGASKFDGFLANNDGWMDDWLAAGRRELSQYFASG